MAILHHLLWSLSCSNNYEIMVVLPFPWIISISHLSWNLRSRIWPFVQLGWSNCFSRGACCLFVCAGHCWRTHPKQHAALTSACWLLCCLEFCLLKLAQQQLGHLDKCLRKVTGLQGNWLNTCLHSSTEKIYVYWTSIMDRFWAKSERGKWVRYQFFPPGINSITRKQKV